MTYIDKKTWRKKMLQKREAMSHSQWQEKCADIHHRLFTHPVWINSQHVALYYAVNKEVNTQDIMKRGWAEGKHIYLPKCEPDKKQLLFSKVESEADLTGLFYGIPEPDPNIAQPLDVHQLDLIIVPGLVFDQQGFRIGYGGGYYDRFLSGLIQEDDMSREMKSVSLAMSFQVVPTALPHDSYDIPVDMILTENRTLTCV
ncbi:5-formyltetrahydrofolate cyclo-ligase [Caldalkalibacillus salinus]|uniref:5-formyltetrahydrofolate cyclo-ligase n=1 Tax=Caldalkalibacillus salinus TaxID=2803787 RepID=UPI001924BF12|nr:5-formyltetrahydrofolate cyclo-ligase [Caldalkalibacillus salinus]